MRVLHVGDDFAALRPCGLTLYSQALMKAQVERGNEVSYVFSGRHYPRLERPRLKRWNDGGVRMFELIGSPNHTHPELGTRHPERDVEDPVGEATFTKAVEETRPDVVHIHELARLPSSVIDRAHDLGVPVVFTLHDYKPLCAATRLIDADGQRCARRDVGVDCARNCAGAPAGRAHLVDSTLRFHQARVKRALPLAQSVDFTAVAPIVGAVKGRMINAGAAADAAPVETAPVALTSPDAYQRRRDVNVRRLSSCDRLVAPSHRAGEIYAELGVDRGRIVVQRLTLPHLETLRPNGGDAGDSPLVFVTLGACASPTKGSRTIVDAVEALERLGRGGQYHLEVFGHVHPEARAALEGVPSVALRGPYDAGDLGTLLEGAHVGIFPSVWEETHGFVGIEMLAKGLPVIASALGGMPEYVRDGETGWLNRSATGAELADLMARALDDRTAVARLRDTVRARRHELVRPMAEHVDEVAALYAEVAQAAAR